MHLKYRSDRPRNFYQMFRDGIFLDAINGGPTRLDIWHLVPGASAHTGASSAISLIRKMVRKMEREFPNGVVIKKNNLILTEEFMVFIRTHFEMETPEQDVIQAWKAMSSFME